MLSAQFNSGYRHHLMRKALSGAFFLFLHLLRGMWGAGPCFTHISDPNKIGNCYENRPWNGNFKNNWRESDSLSFFLKKGWTNEKKYSILLGQTRRWWNGRHAVFRRQCPQGVRVQIPSSAPCVSKVFERRLFLSWANLPCVSQEKTEFGWSEKFISTLKGTKRKVEITLTETSDCSDFCSLLWK